MRLLGHCDKVAAIEEQQKVSSTMVGTLSNIRPASYQQQKYEVQLLRHLTTGWVARLPMLHANITPTELILQPYGFNPPPAAHIPRSYIRTITHQPVDVFSALCIELRDGSSFFITVNWDQEENFLADLQTLKSNRLIRWQPHLPSMYIKRLIQQVMNL